MTTMARLRALESGTVNMFGRKWYVDAKTGSDTNNGRSNKGPFATMSKALTSVDSGDIIIFRGKVREQLTSPVGVFDVTIIGAANRPRHADNHTESGGARGSSAATWAAPASPAATTPLLKVLQQGWRFENFLFAAPTDAAAVQLFRDGGADDAERDASHAHFVDMRLDGGQNHIQFHGGLAWVRMENCFFRGATAESIKNTAGAGIGTNVHFQILNNIFVDNVSHILCPMNMGIIRGNTMAKFTTNSINLTGGTGNNIITGNYLSGTYSVGGGYVKANANDEWAGNFNGLAGAITVADPA